MYTNTTVRIKELEAFRNSRNCLNIMFGRRSSSAHEVKFYSDQTITSQIQRHADNLEFQLEVEASLSCSGYVSGGRFQGKPNQRLINWLANELPIEPTTYEKVERSNGWRELLIAIWSDKGFRDLFDPKKLPPARIEQMLLGLRSIKDAEMYSPSSARRRQVNVIENLAHMIAFGEQPIASAQECADEFYYSIDELKNIEQRNRNFVITNTDPQIIMIPTAMGRYHIILDIVYQDYNLTTLTDYAQIFIDLGQGFREQESLRIPITNNQVLANVFLEIKVPSGQIRIDPCVEPAHINFNYCSINKLKNHL